jgi:uncharacterized membrane protein YesL
MCKHSGISVVLLSCILYYNKMIHRTSEMAHICMFVHVCVSVCVCLCACVYVSMYVRMYLCVRTYICIYGH